MILITYTRLGKPYECQFNTPRFAKKWIRWALRGGYGFPAAADIKIKLV